MRWGFVILLGVALLLAALVFGQELVATSADNQAKLDSKNTKDVANNAGLEAVLNQMDTAAANFKSAQADFIWDQYQKVVNETDSQKGKVYFRRQGKDTQMAADISQPEQKSVLFSDGKVRVYQPKIEQLTEYDAGKNREAFESFLVLGFGGRGHDLPKSFEVRYQGAEVANGVRAAKLELTPKALKVRNMFNRIVLWIDPGRGVSVQQQFFEPSGDYRFAKYNNITMNQKIADSVFKLKTTGKTKVIRPGG